MVFNNYKEQSLSLAFLSLTFLSPLTCCCLFMLQRSRLTSTATQCLQATVPMHRYVRYFFCISRFKLSRVSYMT